MVMVMVQTALTSTSVHSYIELEGVILQGTVTVVKEVSPPSATIFAVAARIFCACFVRVYVKIRINVSLCVYVNLQ